VAEGADAAGAGHGLHVVVLLLVFEVIWASDAGFRKVGGGEDEGHAQSLGPGFGGKRKDAGVWYDVVLMT
jgi:hypothetical protein